MQQHAGHARHLVEARGILDQRLQPLNGELRQRPADVGDGTKWHGASLAGCERTVAVADESVSLRARVA
ncbi:hypothetical protein G6F40_017530 [Rhizopus arrhizus]|uniref:Uncharacterized protein n=1 Tax=Rhizopus delemar TaxID=936053 RepID=A0A9P7C2Y6_9FUNG|nr:hypothetical protein G6F40_017530 [Rhizopus arrhizus]KAG1532957.1 hypothetical protein G6F50_016034 [Rhizopus delemar]